MIWISVACFAVAALGGVIIVQMMLAGRKEPMPLVLAHAGLAVAGLILFILAVPPLASPLLWAILIIFTLAAAGGIVLFSLILVKKWRPLWLIEVHGALALVGITILVMLAAGATR